MINYCTLFDINYSFRAMALYRSLVALNEPFTLYVFAFDDEVSRFVKSKRYPNIVCVSLAEFEDDKLLEIKKTRTKVEYCWTCTPSVILYALEKYSLTECTYLDADLYFFSSPKSIFEEIGNSPVAITQHGFSSKYKDYVYNGIYNVQFMHFKSTDQGILVLNWWRDRCNEWCYNRLEDGKFGDQLYLNDWPERFVGVKVISDIGSALAPWNIQRFRIFYENDKILVSEQSDKKTPLVFYHFHGIKWCKEGFALALGYDLSASAIKYIYRPYIAALKKEKDNISSFFGDLDFGNHVTTKSQLTHGIRTHLSRNDVADEIAFFWGRKSILLLYSIASRYLLSVIVKVLKTILRRPLKSLYRLITKRDL